MGGKYDLLGWSLFTVSGVAFLIAAGREGDTLLVWGSITWLAGVGFFMAGYRSHHD